MKEKKLIAMFITSVVAFVASLTISLGVTFALADPVAAIGLAEITYNVSYEKTANKQVVFDPAGTLNGNIEDYIIVNSYDDVLYANETVSDSIKLLKVAVTNDTSKAQTFSFSINVSGQTNAVNYANFAIINISNHGVVYDVQPSEVIKLNINNTAKQLTIKPDSTAYFIVAGYINDELATEVIDLSVYMNMTVTVNRVDFLPVK